MFKLLNIKCLIPDASQRIPCLQNGRIKVLISGFDKNCFKIPL